MLDGQMLAFSSQLYAAIEALMDLFTDQLILARAPLLRTARARLRNPDWADDAVSETLLAALEQPPKFQDAPRVRAWLFGILRHKLVDQVRRHAGNGTITSVGGWAEIDSMQSLELQPHSDPVHLAGCRQLMERVARALEQLPAPQARAFVMSEVDGSGTAAICAELGVTAGNAWQLVYRARHRLRMSLQAQVGIT